MSLHINIPSKTFLVGEYSILNNCNAILISTKPCFKFILTKSKQNNLLETLPFHRNSPSGKFIIDNKHIFKDHCIIFQDQHNNCGGFGASGAQFLGSYLAKNFILQGKVNIQDISKTKLLDTFWKYNSTSVKPSGGDIISQLNGYITLFDPTSTKTNTLQWNFDDIGFYLIPTYHKLPTHRHLENLTVKFDKSINQVTNNISEAIINKNSAQLINNVNKFNDALLSKDLVTDNTVNILTKLKKCPNLLTAKGCGALGSDVILVIFALNKEQQVKEFIKNQQLSIISSNHDIMSGVEIKYDNNIEDSWSYNEMVC